MRLIRVLYTRAYRTFSKGFFKENTVCCQLLGLCSALAVSSKVENALAMGLGVVFVLILSSFFVALLRKLIPTQYRIITFMVILRNRSMAKEFQGRAKIVSKRECK